MAQAAAARPSLFKSLSVMPGAFASALNTAVSVSAAFGVCRRVKGAVCRHITASCSPSGVPASSVPKHLPSPVLGILAPAGFSALEFMLGLGCPPPVATTSSILSTEAICIANCPPSYNARAWAHITDLECTTGPELPCTTPNCPINCRSRFLSSPPSRRQHPVGFSLCALQHTEHLWPAKVQSPPHPVNSKSRSAFLGSNGIASLGRCLLNRVLGKLNCPYNPATSVYHGVRSYYQSTRGSERSQDQFQVVDLRSDTLSTPNAEMRSAMAEAEVGDDVYGEDPTVNELQRQAAQLFGTEDALFVPSGTMGNLLSVMCHCRRRGEELLVGDKAHLHLYEQGGVAQIAGVSPQLVRNFPDGRLDLEDLESKIQHGYPDPHYPHTRLICLENSHNRTGGRVLPLSYHQEVRLLADRYGLAVHLDGARLMNAAVALGVAPSQIVQHCDSVSLCLSKGLGAPVGSVIGGRKEFIMECLRVRKVLGGGMRQAGILAAAGLLALSRAEDTLKEDHRRAKKFAQGVQELAAPLCSVDISSVETNIVMMRVEEPRISPQQFCERMWAVSEPEIAELGRGVKVRMFVMFQRTVRLVWYCNISEEDTDMALNKLRFVVQKYREELSIV